MKTFSEKVREARTSLKLSQEALGHLVGVSKRAVIAYEVEGTKPRRNTLKKLADALRVSAEYLTQDDIDDPLYGIESAPYVEEARERYGARAAHEIEFLMERSAALFAGGEIPQEAKDAYFEAVMQAYLLSKEKSREKYGRSKKKSG